MRTNPRSAIAFVALAYCVRDFSTSCRGTPSRVLGSTISEPLGRIRPGRLLGRSMRKLATTTIVAIGLLGGAWVSLPLWAEGVFAVGGFLDRWTVRSRLDS